MGVFKGRKRKGLVLASRKRYSLCKKRKKPEFQQRTSERNPGMKRVFTSTPCKTPHNRSFTIFNSPLYKRARLMSPIKQQGGSPFFPKVKQSRKLDFMSERNDSFGRENTNSSLDETYLYSENGFGNSRLMTSFAEGDVASETGSISVIERDITCEEFTADDNTYTLFIDAMKILLEQSVDGEIVSFLNLVSSRRFPLDNVAFQLFLDVVKWFDCEDVRTMRYNDTTIKFFWLGKRLFGGRFLRFMAGPKHETSILQGHSQLHPSSSKINFACPSNSVLSQFNPLGFELNCDVSTGLIDHMLDLVAKNSKETISYVLMFDGKKIKRGADADLLGFEKEPLSEKKLKFDSDIAIVSTMLQKSKEIEALMECGKSIYDKVTSDLFQEIMKCFKVVSKHLMALRQLKKNKEMALHKYKEKIHKNSSLAKTFEYAIDSCKTTLYLIDNCVASLLDVQFVICKTGAYINGCLKLFPRHRGESVNVNNLDNVKMLKIEQADNLPTEQVKQRTERWYKDRHEMKITGSTVYSAIGLDGLKRCQSHFDGIISGVHSDNSTEAQMKAMNHGIASETHEIATLAGIVMPFLFPNSIYCEEGYYIENKMMVSPDGSLRDNTGLNVEYAFEGKAPLNEIVMRCLQHYSVPARYIPQTVLEAKVTGSTNGTIYMCWTSESTTVFKVPFNEQICSSIEKIARDIYTADVPKRPTRIPIETKVLEEHIKTHAKNCEYLGEFPSLFGTNVENCYSEQLKMNDSKSFSYKELITSLHKCLQTLNDVYNLQRMYASQVLVYLLADLDRLWKPELPHAVPVMYCYRGYSLPMDIARKLIEHCIHACIQRGLHVPVVSSDGEFVQLMVQGKNGQPLTTHQLSKQVWTEVCKLKKNEILKLISSVNIAHRIYTDDNGRSFIESIDNGFKLKTPRDYMKTNVKRSRCSFVSTQNEDHCDKQQSNNDHTIEPFNDLADHTMSNTNAHNIPDCDDTIPYEFEETLREMQNKSQCYVLTLNDGKEICYLLKQNNHMKWVNKTPEQMVDMLMTNPSQLLKNELLDVSKYLNLKLIGTENELKIKNVTKCYLLTQLRNLLGSDMEEENKITRPKRTQTMKQPKALKTIAMSVIRKPNYPKQALNIAYATYIWPEKLSNWKSNGKVANRIKVCGPQENDDVYFEPYYLPEFDSNMDDFRIYAYDKTHLGTNLRKALCLDKISGISVDAWAYVSKTKPDVLHPSVIEVTDGKILDQMKELLAKTMVSIAVEEEMTKGGFIKEAELCKLIREGLFEADDMPGIPAFERCKRRLALIEWLNKDVNFGAFPPYGNYIKGMSHILYEGLRTSQEGKLYLYALANSGTYCVRAPNTLCSESFFSSMQETDPWGQGILSSSGVQKHISDFTTITSMKMEDSRNIFIKTKRDAAYPNPTVDMPTSPTSVANPVERRPEVVCNCRENRYIQCIVPRDHYFDTQARARLLKKEKIYQPSSSSTVRGEQPIRAQYGYKINEAKMLPSKRIGIYRVGDHDFDSNA